MQKLKKFVPVVLGLVFIFSGVAKLISIEYFELFIYSFKLCSFLLATIAARLFIGLELMLGTAFLIRYRIKLTSILTLVLLFFFTTFLFYLELSDSKEDCHCFGNLLQLSNTWSIVKNLVMAGLTIVVYKSSLTEFNRFRNWILVGILCLGFGSAFLIHPPDFVYKKSEKGVSYCEPCLQKFLVEQGLNNRKRVICFLSPQCKYCKLAAKKISTISQIAGNQADIVYVFWDNQKGKTDFINQSNSSAIPQLTIGTLDFLSLTKGEMPLILLSDKGNLVQAYRYDDMDEQKIVQFLQK